MRTLRNSAVVIFLFLVPHAVLGQETTAVFPHGTILVYEETTTQVIIVADSKIYDDKTKWGGYACKIVNLSDDTIFFYTGNLFESFNQRTGKVFFSQQSVARTAYGYFQKQSRSENRLMAVANKYSELVSPKINNLLKSVNNPSERIGLAGFASRDELGHPRIVLVNIPVTVPNNGGQAYAGAPTVSEPILNEEYMGNYPQYQQVREFLDAQTPRAKLAMEKFNSRTAKVPEKDKEVYTLIAAVEAALSWNKNDPTIGPPVDAVVIESETGIRWIKRKPKCSDKSSRQAVPNGG
jgi:hypothetical protein